MSRVEEMRAAVARWEESGETQREFAAGEGISYAKFVYWRRRLKELVVRERAKRGEGSLIPVRVVADGPGERFLEVRTAVGHVVRVPQGFDEGELRRLMAVLAEC